jgi:hypothetical protein
MHLSKMIKQIFITSIFLIILTNLKAQSHFSFELHGGGAYSVPLPLTIKQQGYPDLKLTARFHTEAFTLPVYWDMRLSRWKNDKSWELELIHHKLYLDNTSEEVQKFNISHGFNMIMLNRGFDQKTFRYRAGAGIVLAHPESTIRGKEFGSSTDDYDLGYNLTGPVLNLAISKPIRLGYRFYINAEAKTTIAYSYIKVAEGHANVYNLAFHLILGIGFDFAQQKQK